VIGMAVLETAQAEKGNQVQVALSDGVANATVADFPIYDPEKKRPRS
jgi:glycine cleavage system aminomethyltransferase T